MSPFNAKSPLGILANDAHQKIEKYITICLWDIYTYISPYVSTNDHVLALGIVPCITKYTNINGQFCPIIQAYHVCLFTNSCNLFKNFIFILFSHNYDWFSIHNICHFFCFFKISIISFYSIYVNFPILKIFDKW